MPQIVTTVHVDVTPEQAWEVVGDLAAMTEWVPGVVAARVDGDLRVCTMADGSEIHERVSEYSAVLRRYRYAHERQPLPLRRSHGTLSVEEGEGGTVVRWVADVEPEDGAEGAGVAAMLEGAYGEALRSLARAIERRRAAAA